MRKLIWVGLAGTVLLVGGFVCTLAFLADHHPTPRAGRLPFRPGRAAGPVDAGAQVAKRTSSDAIAAEPVGVEDATLPAQIVIPEDDAASAGSPAFEHLLTPSRRPDDGPAVAETHTAPTLMPYCDQESAPRRVWTHTDGEKPVIVTTAYSNDPERMPYADACEKLHMPCIVEEQPSAGAEEEQEATDSAATGAAGKLIRGIEQMMKRTVPTGPADAHRPESGCPHDGHSICPRNGCPGRQSRRDQEYTPTDGTFVPVTVDTAEMRPEDYPLRDCGHGKF